MSVPGYRTSLVTASVLLVSSFAPTRIRADEPLIEINKNTDLTSIEQRNVQLSLIQRGDQHLLQMAAGHATQWPGITIKPNQAAWDLTDFAAIALQVKNAGEHSVRVGLRADSDLIDGKEQTLQTTEEISPGTTTTIRLELRTRMPQWLEGKLFGMRGYPANLHPDSGIDTSRILKILIFVAKPDCDHSLEIHSLQATGKNSALSAIPQDPEAFFPLIDRFGQYIHKDWPGKVKSEDELHKNTQIEDRDLAAKPSPTGWNRFGGWESGPQLEATGQFRVAKLDGSWWLVDPNGRLFWSHGIDCVRPTTAYTPITDREHYFAELPSEDSPLQQFYGRGSWAPHGYYQDKGNYRTFNFTGANLLRKYGPQWQSVFNSRCHQRMRSWGLNTIGNWSDHGVYKMEHTPYVVTVSSGRKRIEGSSGYWGKFPDPFDNEFQETTRGNMKSQTESANSPWCVGVFIDNELAWGEELSLATATLASPADQAAKIAFVGDLKAKYKTIDRLNKAWDTKHESWQDLIESQAPPAEEKAREDLEAFSTRIAKQYFHVCRDAVKDVAPQTLYLGCRFAWVNDRAVRASATYCDVIGFNKYSYSIADFELPAGVDVPVIIGEFHFGALDRGMFHTGLRPTESQDARADAYRNYVRGALKNPIVVGTHWFQFGDQATTGRGDGENYQIGFLDVCDTPYPETIEVSREVAATMYDLRMQRSLGTTTK